MHLTLLAVATTLALAAPKSAPPRAHTAAAAVPAASVPADPAVVWDLWYTASAQGVPYEIYRERVEIRSGRIGVRVEITKLEEGFINEEQTGAFAESNTGLVPLFFNYRSLYRKVETKIDGTVSMTGPNSRKITFKVKRGGADIPVQPAVVRPGTIFASLFPVWLGAHLKKLKPGVPISLVTLREDALEQQFVPDTLAIKLDKPDEFAQSTHTQKVLIEMAGQKMRWWVEGSGAVMRIEAPATGLVVARSTESQARAFLKRPQQPPGVSPPSTSVDDPSE